MVFFLWRIKILFTFFYFIYFLLFLSNFSPLFRWLTSNDKVLILCKVLERVLSLFPLFQTLFDCCTTISQSLVQVLEAIVWTPETRIKDKKRGVYALKVGVLGLCVWVCQLVFKLVNQVQFFSLFFTLSLLLRKSDKLKLYPNYCWGKEER